jgi:prephenate dehydrogenase
MTLTCGFIGLGLIGGSIARAIRKYDPDAILKAYNPSRASLDEALSDGVINAGTQCIDSVLSPTAAIFFSAARSPATMRISLR